MKMHLVCCLNIVLYLPLFYKLQSLCYWYSVYNVHVVNDSSHYISRYTVFSVCIDGNGDNCHCYSMIFLLYFKIQTLNLSNFPNNIHF